MPATLTPIEREDLRVISAMIIPESAEFGVPGADDAAIQNDIIATLGRDGELVHAALGHLARLAGAPLAQLGGEGIPRHRRNGRGNAHPRRAAMLLPRRARGALAWPRATPAISARTYA
jgi:hypothetical protein